MTFIDRVFCRECAKAVYYRSLLKLQLAFLCDTKSYEIFAGFLSLSLGLALFSPADIFPPGVSFSYLFSDGYTTSQFNWGLAFSVIGAGRLFSTVFGTLTCRKWMTLISLYFWLLIIYYLVDFGYYSIFVLFPFIWLAISSIFTFVSIWKRINGNI